jgi:predicted Zn-dependent peptidase
MCADEVFGIKRYGTAEQINAVTPESLYVTWQNLLKTAAVEIMYVGDSAPDKAVEVFSAAFEKIDRAPAEINNIVVRTSNGVKRITEEMEVSQSKLVMGFRTGIALGDDDCTAAALMCFVLGGTASSKLFCNVREKQSLCYYCSSRFDSHKGIIIVDSGVEGDNIEKAEKGILKEIEDMKNGVISDFEIESAKMAAVNAFNASNDTVSGIESWYSAQLFNDRFKTIEERSNELNAVTKEEIIKAANKLSLDTIFVLKNK